ncbi:MAG: hypothetical protein JXR40_13080 [Pontiellaceae bacterium]|nr:hypothetical protein [Pontiellaceae bacterium]
MRYPKRKILALLLAFLVTGWVLPESLEAGSGMARMLVTVILMFIFSVSMDLLCSLLEKRRMK